MTLPRSFILSRHRHQNAVIATVPHGNAALCRHARRWYATGTTSSSLSQVPPHDLVAQRLHVTDLERRRRSVACAHLLLGLRLHRLPRADGPVQNRKQACRRRPHEVVRVGVSCGPGRDGLLKLVGALGGVADRQQVLEDALLGRLLSVKVVARLAVQLVRNPL
eukprot:364556-Chlamydomonas_euryale.AAC.5